MPPLRTFVTPERGSGLLATQSQKGQAAGQYQHLSLQNGLQSNT